MRKSFLIILGATVMLLATVAAQTSKPDLTYAAVSESNSGNWAAMQAVALKHRNSQSGNHSRVHSGT